MRSTFYLKRLYKSNKLLFAGILVFILLNLAANFIFKAEHTPVFVWDLYARPIPEQPTYSFLEVKYNDDRLLTFPHTWKEPEKLFFTNTLDHFITMIKSNGTDPLKDYIDRWNNKHPFFKNKLPGLKFYDDSVEVKKFPAWYKRYLEQYIQAPVYKIDVYETTISYLNNGEIKKISSTLIYKLL
ncbi:MAG: hypothetical protein M3Z56_01915 [Bacteroidota bacterium]|nr:hypothetical protein [Bacteroidota bacterium]